MENINFSSIKQLLEVTYKFFYDKYLKYFKYNIEQNFLKNTDEAYYLEINPENNDISIFLRRIGFTYQKTGHYFPVEVCGILDDKILDKIIFQRYTALVDVLSVLETEYKVFPVIVRCNTTMPYYIRYANIIVMVYRTDEFLKNSKKNNKLGKEQEEKRNSILGRVFNRNYIHGICGYNAKYVFDKKGVKIKCRKITKCPRCGKWSCYHADYCSYCDSCDRHY